MQPGKTSQETAERQKPESGQRMLSALCSCPLFACLLTPELRAGITRRHADRDVALHAVAHRVRFHRAGRAPAPSGSRSRGSPCRSCAARTGRVPRRRIVHAALPDHALLLFAHHPARRDRDLPHALLGNLLGHAARLVADVLFLHHAADVVRHRCGTASRRPCSSAAASRSGRGSPATIRQIVYGICTVFTSGHAVAAPLRHHLQCVSGTMRQVV